MKKDTRYNGWTNYETWNVALWMDNDDSEYWNEQAQGVWDESEKDTTFSREERAALDLAETIKSAYEENTPTVTGPYADLLNAALSEVNWYEIAQHFIAEVDKEVEA